MTKSKLLHNQKHRQHCEQHNARTKSRQKADFPEYIPEKEDESEPLGFAGQSIRNLLIAKPKVIRPDVALKIQNQRKVI